MFSLCIPTMNRFDSFLVRYIPEYLKNDLIHEIIISDETGADVEKIRAAFQDPKLKLIQNNTSKPRGPFLNKLEACRNATQPWIALIDSDNFADRTYFETAKRFIESNTLPDATILAPCWAMPRFDYRHLSGFVYTNSTLRSNWETEMRCKPAFNSEVLMNTGNYILRNKLLDSLDLTNEQQNIPLSSACDVIYMNTLLFEQKDLHLYVVPGLQYEHVVHDGSVYIQTHQQFSDFTNHVHTKYRSLLK